MEMRHVRARRWRTLAATGIAAAAFASGAPAPGAAQDAPLVVTPSTDLVDGQEVTVTVNGPQRFLLQCDADVLSGMAPTDACGPQTSVADEARPVEVPFTVHSTVTSYTGRPVDCGLAPEDCLIAAANIGGADFVTAPITVEPPAVTATPIDEPLLDGARLTVSVRGTPGEAVTVAQCASPPGAAVGDSRCGPATELVLGDDGRATTALTVGFVVDTSGDPVDCQAEDCAVAAFDSAGALIRAVPITFVDPLVITVNPTAGLYDGAQINASVRGYRARNLNFYQCVTGAVLSDTVVDCHYLGRVASGSRSEVLIIHVDPAVGNVPCDGQAGDCMIGVSSSTWSPWITTVPLAFSRAVLQPASTGLVDGQPVTLSATGLAPDTEHILRRCDPTRTPSCESGPEAPRMTSDSQGNLDFPTTAAQRIHTGHLGGPEYCRTECTFVLQPFGRSEAWAVTVPYAMAEGSLAASPSTGLADGDTVTLTGTDLMASYEGPALWIFPTTGAWGIGQCAATAVDDPSVLGMFSHCAVAPPGVASVPGSTLSVDVTVAARFTSVLGDEVDCTTGPDACSLVLMRIEQDGSISVHAAPVSVEG
ncbi:MAG: hypothetical protein JXA83_00080 [Acidimicrobiales bacterium]|nr:hypothetical protein [Acidimicrobiales bacterium]